MLKIIVVTSLICFSLSTLVLAARDENLIGWNEQASPEKHAPGQGRAPHLKVTAPTIKTQGTTALTITERNDTGVEVMSWSPRILLYRGFLTDG